ncbi:hypothetical protein [Vannielia sp. SX4]|uniref:hypothetical protein n=1 Tax=Vannielia sp. SX4 TaxID=3463852 RepID=UPI00405939C0
MDGFSNNASQRDEPAKAFAAMLAPVRSAFLASLPDHIAAFEEFCELECDEDRLELAGGLARRAHRIFGVAETLSFPKLGRSALDLEIKLGARTEIGALDGLVTNFVSEMRQALHA